MKVSIIIPHYNDSDNLKTCLRALEQLCPRPHEIIIVDDGSDRSVLIESSSGITFYKNTKHSGPGTTRNIGANIATGDLFFFVDSDVQVNNSAYTMLIDAFQNDRSLVAAFGSYDDSPLHRNIVSQYANLRHHYCHQALNQNVSTFWTGFGAVRAKDFKSIKGFSSTIKSLEDIDLGVRLSVVGSRIRLVPEASVKHLKRWSFGAFIKTDIFGRAIPWSKLLLENPQYGNTLNVSHKERLTAFYALLIPVFLMYSVYLHPFFIILVIMFLAAFLRANAGFFKVIRARNNWHKSLCCFLLHWLYYVYSSMVFVCVFLYYQLEHMFCRLKAL